MALIDDIKAQVTADFIAEHADVIDARVAEKLNGREAEIHSQIAALEEELKSLVGEVAEPAAEEPAETPAEETAELATEPQG